MTTLREAAQQALEALETCDAAHPSDGGQQWYDEKLVEPAITALRTALAQPDEPVQEPVACAPQYANDDGWCDWVCPKPIGYLMQCCGCGLIHEVESRVAKYKPRPSEEFEVVGDPDLQVQWRMKRRDDISPKQKTQEPVARECSDPMCACRGGPCAECEEGQREKEIEDLRFSLDFYQRRCEALQSWQSKMRDPERTIVCDILANGFTLDPAFAGDRYTPKPLTEEPVAWRFEARHIDTAWGPAVSLKRPGPEHKYIRNVIPLYTTPPPRKPLTEEEIHDRFHAARNAKLGASLDNSKHRLSVVEIARAIERAHGIGGSND